MQLTEDEKELKTRYSDDLRFEKSKYRTRGNCIDVGMAGVPE